MENKEIKETENHHPELLFVYGHLRSGDCAEHLVKGLPFHGKVRTAVNYRMLACAQGEFPGLIKESKTSESFHHQGILGELRQVNDPQRWAAMDEYEDIENGTYSREFIQLEDGRRVQAYLYTAEDKDQQPDAGDDWQKCPLRKKPKQTPKH